MEGLCLLGRVGEGGSVYGREKEVGWGVCCEGNKDFFFGQVPVMRVVLGMGSGQGFCAMEQAG